MAQVSILDPLARAAADGTHLFVELVDVVGSLDLSLLDSGVLLELLRGRHLGCDVHDAADDRHEK